MIPSYYERFSPWYYGGRRRHYYRDYSSPKEVVKKGIHKRIDRQPFQFQTAKELPKMRAPEKPKITRIIKSSQRRI